MQGLKPFQADLHNMCDIIASQLCNLCKLMAQTDNVTQNATDVAIEIIYISVTELVCLFASPRQSQLVCTRLVDMQVADSLICGSTAYQSTQLT